ncbi:MAG: photosynthetic complex assembly protein PuhC, partial [Tagaea sp.]
PETPFRLSMWRDGSLVLDDPATGRRVDLRAFGATNRDAFARLLPRSGVALAGETR